MQSTPIVRPSWFSLHRQSLAGMIAIGASMLVIGHVMREAPAQTIHVPLPIPAPVPTIVSVPVSTPLTIPQPDVHVTVSPPEAEEVDEELSTSTVRARVPMIDPTCIAPMIEREGDGVSSCEWDDGMPAISEDGMRIVTWVRRYDATVAMVFVDTETSRVVREERLVLKSEMGEYTAKPEHHTRIKKRIAALQKELDDGGFRSLIEPATNAPYRGDPIPRGLYVERATFEPAARLVDGTTRTQLWRGEFDSQDEYPAKPDLEASACYPQRTSQISPYWDLQTRTVFVEVAYQGLEETCALREHFYVRHMAES